jgi:hypothetical protein
MEDTFAAVLFVVVGVAAVVAVWALASSGGSYRQIGRGGTSIADDRPDDREAEIRQNARGPQRPPGRPGGADPRRRRRARELTAPAADPADLRDEVRTLVEASNARRTARGEPPFDVEAETERRLRELG